MLNETVLGNDLFTAANQWNDTDIADLEQARKDFWNAIAAKIIEHITSSAVVNVTVATTGSATAQTGTGTGTIS